MVLRHHPDALSSAGILGLTRPDDSAVHNIDESVTVEASTGGRWGFPNPRGQSLSYWLQQVRCDELLNHRTTEELPHTASTVVVGSGLTGSLVAKYHKQTWPDKSIVVLEARDFCSGATGRNAGHCKPDQWRGFGKYEKQFGAEQAMKILQNEQDTWEALVSYVRENNVDCDLWIGDTLDVPMTPETAAIAHENFTRYKLAGGKVDHIKETTSPAEAARITRLQGAQACYAWPASTLQPRKLARHIMLSNLANDINLQTFTPARKISTSKNSHYRWTVHTERGNIYCDNVVHASNAYMAAYEPSVRGIITPKPHMCNKVIPPLSFSGSKALKNSYGVLLPDGGLFSINPRYGSDGVVMFGGSNPGQRKLDAWVNQHPQHCVNDALANIQAVTDEVRKFAEAEFEGWRESIEADGLGPGQGYDYSWSGIIGLSSDGVPFVGELPGKKGQWMCAGHCGHGMARIFTAAPGLIKLMNGEDWVSTGLPDVYRSTEERLERLGSRLGSSKGKVVEI